MFPRQPQAQDEQQLTCRLTGLIGGAEFISTGIYVYSCPRS